jgi:alpha-1,2-mannosyltransferase
VRRAVVALGQITHGSMPSLGAVRVTAQRLAEVVLFAIFPVIIPLAMAAYLAGTWGQGVMLYDLNVMWHAGRDVAHGHSPYPFVYPAPAAVLMAPFGALPWKAAVVLWWAVCVAALLLALHLLGVRDWRCYGAVFASPAAMWALEIGTITPLLVLATAAAWRYRDRRWVVASAITFVIVTKLFLWPLAVWLLATRRFRTLLATVATCVVITIGSWAMIGFAGFLDYPHHLGGIASLVQYTSFSSLAFAKALGLSASAAHVASLLVAVAALGFIFRAARGSGGDRRAFVWALGASLLISPIVWAHYFILLFVPIAIASRRLSLLWLLPLGYWVLPHTAANGSIIVLTCGLAITMLVLVMSAESGVEPSERVRSPIESLRRRESPTYIPGTAV